ncbi:hypothetical protein HZS_5753, partial [Henneguya salminicola]
MCNGIRDGGCFCEHARLQLSSELFDKIRLTMAGTRKRTKDKQKLDISIDTDNAETIKKIIKNNKLTDVVLDLSNDSNISENRFLEIYMTALKKVNPRSNHAVLQYLINCKWKHFCTGKKSNQTQLRSTRSKKRTIVEDDYEAPPKKSKKNFTSASESETSEHNDLCEFCEKPGELLLCDSCSAAYHLNCIEMTKDSVPEGDWKCPLCLKEEKISIEEKPEKIKPKKETKTSSKSETRNEDDNCYHCGQTGPALVCSHCLKSFHHNCSIPPIKSKPHKWKCQYCSAKPIENQIEKILFWKFVKYSVK